MSLNSCGTSVGYQIHKKKRKKRKNRDNLYMLYILGFSPTGPSQALSISQFRQIYVLCEVSNILHSSMQCNAIKSLLGELAWYLQLFSS